MLSKLNMAVLHKLKATAQWVKDTPANLKWFARNRRAEAKALTWRGVASTDTFTLGMTILYLFPEMADGSAEGSASIAGMMAVGEIFTKLALYWLHEKAWQRVPNDNA